MYVVYLMIDVYKIGLNPGQQAVMYHDAILDVPELFDRTV